VDIYWIWLSLIRYVGPILQKRLLLEFETPEKIYFASQCDLEKTPHLNKRAIHSVINSRDLSRAREILKRCEEKGIKLLPFTNDLYPSFAKAAQESPILLYYKGQLLKINDSIGVVGSRRCTAYGRKAAENIGTALALHDVPLISGFAKGIDSYAQASCIKQGGYTAIFLGGGPDVCYPPEQHSLYHKTLEKGGAFLSQYPPGTNPSPKQFLQRNALISAWSQELVVVEASENSGALWTADFSRKQGKPIYALPHSIYLNEGKGSNLLLARGAIPYLGIESLRSIHSTKSSPLLTPLQEEDPIIKLLSESPLTIPKLQYALNSTDEQLLDKLVTLELEGKIIIRGEMVSIR